jgi:phosphoenolpyruvate carboxykinase (GTP)
MKTFGMNAPENGAIRDWVESTRNHCEPDEVFWVDGSEAERDYLYARAVEEGVLIKLNQEKLPGCYYHRSNPNDVARVEQCTFICTTARMKRARPTTGRRRARCTRSSTACSRAR